MTVAIRYIGTIDRYFETAVTGKSIAWSPGRISDVPNADATLLLATGLFDNPYGDALTLAQVAAVAAGVTARVGGAAPFAAIGDSIVLGGHLISSTPLVDVGYGANGFTTWLQAFSMGALWIPQVKQFGNATPLVNYNFGVGGARTQAVRSVQIPLLAALAVKPRFCVIHCGTNNLGVSYFPTETTAQLTQSIIDLCEDVFALGITPILTTILPRLTTDTWSGYTLAQTTTAKGRMFQVNRDLAIYAAQRPGIIFCDWFNVLLDRALLASSGVLNSMTQGDYTHPNVPGAIALGKYLWECVKPFVSGTTPQPVYGIGDAYHATNNPYGAFFDGEFVSSGGTVTGPGTVAMTAWSTGATITLNDTRIIGTRIYKAVAVPGNTGANAPAHTVGQAWDGTPGASVLWEYVTIGASAGAPLAVSVLKYAGTGVAGVAWGPKPDNADGTEILFTCVAAPDNTSFRHYATAAGGSLPDANFIAGDGIYYECDVEVDGSFYGNPDVEIRIAGGSAYRLWGAYNNGGNPALSAWGNMTGKFKYRIRSPIAVIPIGMGTGHAMWPQTTVALGGSATVRRSRESLRKYDKTAPGAITWTGT